jgi:hypothetical protein
MLFFSSNRKYAPYCIPNQVRETMSFQTDFVKEPLYILFGNCKYFAQQDFVENQILCPADAKYLPTHSQTGSPP